MARGCITRADLILATPKDHARSSSATASAWWNSKAQLARRASIFHLAQLGLRRADPNLGRAPNERLETTKRLRLPRRTPSRPKFISPHAEYCATSSGGRAAILPPKRPRRPQHRCPEENCEFLLSRSSQGLARIGASVVGKHWRNGSRKCRSRAAAAVFSQYETVFYTNTDLSSRFSSFKGLSRQSAGSLSLPFAYLMGALDSLDPRASEEILGKTDALVAGVRDFIPPEGEGGAQRGNSRTSLVLENVAHLAWISTSIKSQQHLSAERLCGGGWERFTERTPREMKSTRRRLTTLTWFSRVICRNKSIARKLSSPDDGSSVLNKIPNGGRKPA